MLAWLVKSLALRYSGRRSYGTLTELGMAIIPGDCVVGGLWAVWDAATNTETFNPWPSRQGPGAGGRGSGNGAASTNRGFLQRTVRG